MISGYVVDFEVVSNICVDCERFERNVDNMLLDKLKQSILNYKQHYDKNYDGSSDTMEVEAAKRIWQRSAETGLRYTTMLSDGDSKAFDAIVSMRPYGDVDIKKEECINHVAKRLTAGLESLKSKGGPSGLSLGGRGMLTRKAITMLHSYYHKAIKTHAGDTEKMPKDILAAPYHVTSTDQKPMHPFLFQFI